MAIRSRILALIVVLFAGLPLSAAATAAEVDATLPRTSVRAGGLELVLVLAKDRLLAFVDRLDDNAPAGVRRLAVESGHRRWELEEAGPGLYEAARPNLPPGQWPLTVDIDSRDGTGRFTATLTVPDRSPATGPHRTGWIWWLVAAGALGALVVMRMTGRGPSLRWFSLAR